MLYWAEETVKSVLQDTEGMNLKTRVYKGSEVSQIPRQQPGIIHNQTSMTSVHCFLLPEVH